MHIVVWDRCSGFWAPVDCHAVARKGQKRVLPNKENATKAAPPLRFPGHGPAYEKERHYVTHSADEMVSI